MVEDAIFDHLNRQDKTPNGFPILEGEYLEWNI
jgi:hypothetical protein